MRSPKPGLVLALISLQLIFGCGFRGGNSNATNDAVANAANIASNAPKDHVEEFAELVRLPFEPQEVAWKENPTAKSLTAVVLFSSENAAKMASAIAKNGQPTAETLGVENWYPTELIAQSEMTGESTLKGQSFPAEPFLNPPYTKGKITRIEGTDYFILQISS